MFKRSCNLSLRGFVQNGVDFPVHTTGEWVIFKCAQFLDGLNFKLACVA